MTLSIKFWGTRGSIPVSGPAYQKMGGNTCCLEVRTKKTCLIIDAGTGIRELGDKMADEECDEIHLIFTHLHLDHIIALPFFRPMYQKKRTIYLWGASHTKHSLKQVLEQFFMPETFPICMSDYRAQLQYMEIPDNKPFTIGDLELSSIICNHPSKTLAFKITHNNKTFAYCTDNEFFPGLLTHPKTIQPEDLRLKPHRPQIDFFSHCPLLIHEAQYFPDEYEKRQNWGHSSIYTGSLLAKLTRPKQWLITHHEPAHTDTQLLKKKTDCEKILSECHASCDVAIAYDGLSIDL